MLVFLYFYGGLGAMIALWLFVSMLLAEDSFDLDVADWLTRWVLNAQVFILYGVTATLSGAFWPLVLILRMRAEEVELLEDE